MSTDYGVKSSRVGDVSTADDKDLSLSSDYPSVMMDESHVAVYDYTFPDNPAGDRTLVTVAHGYSYTPACLCYVDDIEEAEFTILRYNAAAGFGIYQRFIAYTDATNFYILYENTAAGAILDMTDREYVFKYYILAQRGI